MQITNAQIFNRDFTLNGAQFRSRPIADRARKLGRKPIIQIGIGDMGHIGLWVSIQVIKAVVWVISE